MAFFLLFFPVSSYLIYPTLGIYFSLNINHIATLNHNFQAINLSCYMDKSKIVMIAVCLSLGFSVGMLVGWNLERSGTKRSNIKWKFGENELEIDLEQDMLDASTFLGKIFSEDFSKDGAVGWLKKTRKIFHYTDPDLVDELSKLEVEHLLSVKLRSLSQGRKGPWSYQFDTVYVSIPAKGYQPKEGLANVCESGKFLRNKVQLYNLDQNRSITIFASGKYACPEGLKHSDIQLNAKDAKALLGSKNFSKYERGIALILN